MVHGESSDPQPQAKLNDGERAALSTQNHPLRPKTSRKNNFVEKINK